MAKVSSSFKTKFELVLDSRMGKALAQMENMSACAGIRNDPVNAFKARVNHYGGTITRRDTHLENVGTTRYGRAHLRSVRQETEIRIPERHFIDVPLEKDRWIFRWFEERVAEVLSGGRMRNIAAESTSIGLKGGVKRDLAEIGKKLAEAQIEAIMEVQPDNAESTIKKKGFNAPLIETYAMINSIKGWQE